MNRSGAVGYIGVDVLNNATVCNEAAGLLRAGVPLDVVSVRRFDRPTYHRDGSLHDLSGRLHALYPLGVWAAIWALAAAPWAFGLRFWVALARAVGCPAEGWRQKARVVAHFVPAVCVALRWRRRGVAHVHAHWAHTATTIGMHAAELLGVGFSFTGHANDLFVHRVALRAKARRARFVVCISDFHRRLFRDLGADPSRLPVVYCGIDTDCFRPAGRPADQATARPRILGVGRLVEKKGFHRLVAACAVLRDRGVPAECVIAGSGPEEGRLRALVVEFGLEDRVTVTGRAVLQEDLGPLLRSAAVVALPCVRDRDGDMDGLPQVLIEAMACGVPVVSTNLVGVPDLVRDGWNGRLVPPDDVPALADGLSELVADPHGRAVLGRRGEGWARRHFGRDETVRRLSDLFTHAASTPGRTPPARLWGPAPETPADGAGGAAPEPDHARSRECSSC